jgi:hypothetical protein
VWSKDQLTGEVSLKPVTNVFVHQVNSLLNLWVKGQKLTTTKNHIFYVAGKGWIEAGQILPKDKVMMKDGSLEEVTGTEEVALTEAVNVYNFEVADWHTYFVGQGVLVHNQSIESCEAVGKLFVISPSMREVGLNGQTEVYRVLRPDEDIAKGLVAKIPSRNMSIEGHLISGSRNNGSQFISTTTDINVAKKWAAKEGNRIVKIDLEKLPDSLKLYDLSTEAGRANYINPNAITANRNAASSYEVLLEGFVPADALELVK